MTLAFCEFKILANHRACVSTTRAMIPNSGPRASALSVKRAHGGNNHAHVEDNDDDSDGSDF